MRLEFERELVRLIAVKKAAYHLSAMISCEISVAGNLIVCDISSLDKAASDEEVRHAFRTTVLDYDLREQIGEKTETIRNAILAAAFAPLTSKLQK